MDPNAYPSLSAGSKGELVAQHSCCCQSLISGSNVEEIRSLHQNQHDIAASLGGAAYREASTKCLELVKAATVAATQALDVDLERTAFCLLSHTAARHSCCD